MKCEYCGNIIKEKKYAKVFGNIMHKECVDNWFEENKSVILYDNTVYIEEVV